MRVVLDTNVMLAAFATRGLCEAVLEVCLTAHQVVLSDHILTELRRHLDSKLKIPTARSTEIIEFLRQRAEIVTPQPVAAEACRDPSDLPVLGTIVAGHADCLITGDRDLLVLGSYEGIPILSPRAFSDFTR